MDKRILILKRLILANLKSPLTLEQISVEFNIFASRLRQLIKEETGMPFGEYVRHLRLERAASNLEQPHKINVSFNFDLWKNLKISPAVRIESGFLYTLTTGTDDNRDTVFNDRPFGIGRNTRRGEWLKQIDTRIQWKVPMKYFLGNENNTKRSINLTANIRNLFNSANLINYVGVQTSPFFGQPTSARPPRSIDFGMSFNF